MTRALRTVTLAVLLTTCGTVAWAQTTLTADPGIVGPGGTVSLRVTGPAGQRFAVIGSAVNSGFSYAGVALAVGSDVVILAQGVLDGTGVATLGVIPPFNGTTLDRYYLQAVTSPSAAFNPLSPSAGVVIRNRDASGSGITGTTVLGTVSTLSNICNPTVIASTPLTITTATKIFAAARGSYTRNGTNLLSGVMNVLLKNAANVTVASSYRAIGTVSSPTGSDRTPISLSQILKVYDTTTGPTAQDFVATPGSYALQLTMSGSDGSCSGSPGVWDPALTYLLVGAQ